LSEAEYRNIEDEDNAYLLNIINGNFPLVDGDLRQTYVNSINLLNQYLFNYVMGDLNTGDKKKNLQYRISNFIDNPIDKKLIENVENFIIEISNKPMNQSNAQELADTYYNVVEHMRELSQVEDGALLEAIQVILGSTTILAYLPNDFLFEDKEENVVNIKLGYRIVEYDATVKRDNSILFYPNGNTDNSFSIVSEYTGGLELKEYPEKLEGPLSEIAKEYTAQEIEQIIDERKADRSMSGPYGFAITLMTLNQKAKNELESFALAELPRQRTLGE
jgi:hypothetical protein